MHLLLVGPKENYPTDGVTIKGIKNLLTAAIGAYTYDYIFLDDHKEQVLRDRHCDYDAMVVCGSPWLWDGFDRSWKFKNLAAIKNFYGCSKIIGMGLGSCFCEDKKCGQIPLKSLDKWREVFSGLNFFRDSVIANELHGEGVSAPCPSFYSTTAQPEKQYNAIVLYSPELGVSSSCMAGDQFRAWEKDLKSLIQMTAGKDGYPTKFFVVEEREKENWQKRGITKPIEVLKNAEHTIDAMGKAAWCVSGRVHCAIPATIQGAKTLLMSVDTRFLTFAEYDAHDLPRGEEIYVKEIKEYLCVDKPSAISATGPG